MKLCPLCAQSYPDSERFCAEHALPLSSGEPDLDGLVRGELTGHVLDRRYLLGGVLGAGGMGTVYATRNLRNGHGCAVKVLLPELCRDGRMRLRLFREIQAASQLEHPNVVKILDYGEDERAGAFLVMELLTGRSLDQVMRDHGAMSLCFSVKVALQLCDALAAIHSHGLVHCDLKPSNVYLLPDNRVKVLDLGLVKPYDPESKELFQRITTGAITFGTPHYMSPEQAGFAAIDPRSDLYSLGVVLFEMLLGKPPFDGKSPVEVMDAHRSEPLPLPGVFNPKVVLPGPVEVLLLKLLRKVPDDRPESAAALAETLETIAETLRLDLSSVDLGPVAGGAAPVPEATQPLDVTLPLPAPIDDFNELARVAQQRRDELVETTMAELCETIPRFRSVDPQLLRRQLAGWLDAFLEQMQPVPPEALPQGIEEVLATRSKDRFTATELLGAFWIGYWASRPALKEVAGQDLERYLALQERFERRLLPFYLRVANRLVATFNQSMGRKNQLLAHQNEELLELRNQLDAQLKRTSGELAEAERVKARVAEAISSGLLLLKLETRRVLLFNRPLERLSGLRAADVVGRPIDDIFHLVEGVPWEEFVEQVRMHGQVGLRKLKLRFPSGKDRTVYLRGQPYTDSQGRQTAVLFVIEDVTEREKIIENFSRYVSREVAQRILRGEEPLAPLGEHRRAVLLVVGIRGFRGLLNQLSGQQVVDLLDQYIRAVGNAIFHHGGTIDSVVGDCALVYFAGRNQSCSAPVQSAIELLRRIDHLDARRRREGLPGLQVGVGLHVGEVLLLHVGGQRRTVHTVVGEPAAVARALQAAASAGELLVTDAVARDLDERFELEPGLPVRVKGHPAPVPALRVNLDVELESPEDLDPPTLT
jgi:PAS domain S-box-containing protein